MRLKIKHLFLFLFFICLSLGFSQEENSNKFKFFPSGLLISPLKTNIEEARVGLVRFLDRAQMKVELGNSVDLLEYSPANQNYSIRAGIDFLAYAFVKDHQGLYLQIDAIDGFFGGNISIASKDSLSKPMLRLRILHHSAHLADGNYWIHSYPREWSKPGGPIPFTRDFGELVLLHHLLFEEEQLRYYGGFSYTTLNRPAEYNRFSGMVGIEFTSSRLHFKLVEKNVSPYLSLTTTFTGGKKYFATNNLQTGFKIGDFYGKGVNIFVSYFNGRNMFGEYFDQRLETIGAGFGVDF